MSATQPFTVATLLIASIAQCTPDWDNSPVCVAEECRLGCLCPTAEPGYQVCSADGLSQGECTCGSPPASMVCVDPGAGGDGGGGGAVSETGSAGHGGSAEAAGDDAESGDGHAR